MGMYGLVGGLKFSYDVLLLCTNSTDFVLSSSCVALVLRKFVLGFVHTPYVRHIRSRSSSIVLMLCETV